MEMTTVTKGESMANYFKVNGLPTAKHSAKTKRILEAVENKSQFLRDAILELAQKNGFTRSISKPEFIGDGEWRYFSGFQSKSRHIDYSYLLAYFYLLDKFSSFTSATIQRWAIEEKGQSNGK